VPAYAGCPGNYAVKRVSVAVPLIDDDGAL